MPRLPGREPTAKKVKIENLSVASFIMQHEEWFWRRPCAIKGCDHRMGPDTSQPRWALEWESCDAKQLPAFVAEEVNGEWVDRGIACPCHVSEILAGAAPLA